MTDLPWFLWAAGANAVCDYQSFDMVRCSECGRKERLPAWYELGRVLCKRHHRQRVEEARRWMSTV